MKKLKNILIVLVICMSFLINMNFCPNIVRADVGSFEDYSSSDWGSDSWDTDWSSDAWDSGSYRSSNRGYAGSYGSGDSFGLGGIIGMLMSRPLLVIILIITVIILKKVISGGNTTRGKADQYRSEIIYHKHMRREETKSMAELENIQMQIEKKIQQTDPNFNKEEFIAWSKSLFIKLQQAWSEREWLVIRTFETQSLFEQHKSQLQGYIDNNQINVMDRICVNYAHLYDYRQEGDKEVLTVRLNSRMQDYIIDATTKEVIKGDKVTPKVNTYMLTFIRKNGVKTKEGTIEVNTTNCPNCGAPTQITSAGKCEYCGSVITTGEYNWVLSNLERETFDVYKVRIMR